MNKRFPFPKRYWVYLSIVLICSILLIGNIYLKDNWTGDKEFSEYTQQDWNKVVIFCAEELVIAAIMTASTVLCAKISKKRDAEIAAQLEKDKYVGLDVEKYDYVWFDFGYSARALIVEHGDKLKLYVEEYNVHTGEWEGVNGVGIFDSLETIKKHLYFECDFYCEANTKFDKYEEAEYKEDSDLSKWSRDDMSLEFAILDSLADDFEGLEQIEKYLCFLGFKLQTDEIQAVIARLLDENLIYVVESISDHGLVWYGITVEGKTVWNSQN